MKKKKEKREISKHTTMRLLFPHKTQAELQGRGRNCGWRGETKCLNNGGRKSFCFVIISKQDVIVPCQSPVNKGGRTKIHCKHKTVLRKTVENNRLYWTVIFYCMYYQTSTDGIKLALY